MMQRAKLEEAKVKFKKYLSGLDMLDLDKTNKIVDEYIRATAMTFIPSTIQQMDSICSELEKIFVRHKKVVVLGRMLKKTRELKNISGAKLGELSGLSPSLISKIENGKSYLPKVESLVRVAEVLEVNPSVFLDIIKNYDDDKYLDTEREENWETKIAKIVYELEIKGENLNSVINFIKYTQWNIRSEKNKTRKEQS